MSVSLLHVTIDCSSDVRVPLMLLVVVIVAQQCSGMKIIQGYAVEIFADTFTERSHGGLKHGHEVDSVAYWSAVIMGGVRLGQHLSVVRNYPKLLLFCSCHPPCCHVHHKFRT